MSAVATDKTPLLARFKPTHLADDMVDGKLIGALLFLLALGLVMVASASMNIAERDFGGAWHYTIRQALFIGMGLALALVVTQIPMSLWQRQGPLLLIASFVMLIVVLIPGIGKEVNGAQRWLNLGIINLQVSELVKLFVVIYLAGYLVRRIEEVRATVWGFIKPMAMLGLLSVLLLVQPDFGATAVMMAAALGMMFLAGVRLWQYGVLVLVVGGAMAVLAVTSPYRMQRLTTFLNPWADEYVNAGGYQLAQALIAIGRGEIWGVGLGSGMQKLFYLPEAHTDFIFSVLAEELGLIGSLLVLGLFTFIFVRAFLIARQAERCDMQFGAYVAYGLALWFGLQAYINMGVNMGVLPTKGLTLPLMSYGGSSMIVSCLAMALLLRIDYEVRRHSRQAARTVQS